MGYAALPFLDKFNTHIQQKKHLIPTDSPQPHGDNGNLGNGWLSSICYILATSVKSAEDDSDEQFSSFRDDNYS